MRTYPLLIFLSILIILNIQTSLAQSFEGRVIYKVSAKPKSQQFSNEQLTAMVGDTQEFFIQGGYNKSVYNGTKMEWQIYRADENKVYTKVSDSEVIFWQDGAFQNDEILKTELNRAVTKVLDYTCDELILTCESGLYKYYFNTQFGIDAKLYEKYKYTNVAAKLAQIKALSLKSIADTPLFTIESVAIEVKPMKLDKKTFDIPANSSLVKSPW
jgi:hypothetical protein